MAKKGYIVSDQKIEIEKLVPGGQGIGTTSDGKKGFFWGVLPGEIVTEYRVTKDKSKYFEAVALKVGNSSAQRIEPADPCYLSTSPWQIMTYEYELKQKAEILVEIFRQEGIEIDEVAVATDGNDFNYRNKMEYALYWDNETGFISPAMHERGSHRKVPINKSSIERPEIFAKAIEVIDDLNARHEEARKYQSLLLRCDQQGNVSGGLFENGKPHPVFDNLEDEILGKKYSYSPNGFFQINLPVYEMALREMQKHIVSENVLDLYAGVGTIGLSVASEKDLTLVEINAAAFGEMEKNCEAAGGKAHAVLAPSEEVLEYVGTDQTVILDPPRAGCDKKLIDKLIEKQPSKVIYLSCNPITQARDIKMMLDSGMYKIEKVQPFNFFPRTPHLENLVVLQKA